ncbi:MAG: ATP-binding protein [Thermodesulfovibrionales bacterium]|nr:ATP-binding protein [Thermodesulfovibrionales bacterium]
MTKSEYSSNLLDLGYRYLIDTLPCYLSIQDSSLHILFANQTFRNDFGNGTGKLCHMVYKGSPDRCPSCPVQKTFKDKKVHISEETVQLYNGSMAQMIVHSAPIMDITGNVSAVVEMSTNITKVMEMQKELTLLGKTMAILSHDIKNILEGLQGGAYVVDEAIKDGDMKLARKGWDITKRNITEISTVVQNILYSSKKRALEYQKVAPDEIVREAVALFQDKAKNMDIALRAQANRALPLVNIDPYSIHRMLNNLIWNALQACKNDNEKGSHTVVVRADFYDRLHFMFEVEDNGIGMDEETRNNIFKEFFSTKGHGGTGLGLIVVEKIVQEHEGKIEVLTTPGKGSTFRVILKIN